MEKKSSWVYRLAVYRIILQKNKKYKPPRSMTLWWRETEGEGDGDGHTTYIGRTTLKESVNHPLTGKPS